LLLGYYFKIIFVIIILCLCSSIAKCQQDSTKKNTVYLELGGNNYYYSFNYEKNLLFNFCPRIGAAIVPYGETTNLYGTTHSIKIYMLIMLNYSLRLSKNHFIEAGYGYFNILSREYVYPTLSLSYKFIPNNSKIVLKASFTPIFDNVVYHQRWFGLGIGFVY
jgi:hypothetical protein